MCDWENAYIAAEGGGTVCTRREAGRHRLFGSGSFFVELRQHVESSMVPTSGLSAPETVQLGSPSIAFLYLVGFMNLDVSSS